MPQTTFSLPVPTAGQTTKQLLDGEINRVLTQLWAAVLAGGDEEAIEALVEQLGSIRDNAIEATADNVQLTTLDRQQTAADRDVAALEADRAETALTSVQLLSQANGAAREATLDEAIIAGRALVTDGQTFIAVGDDTPDGYYLYRRDSSTTQTLLARYPSGSVYGVTTSQPWAWVVEDSNKRIAAAVDNQGTFYTPRHRSGAASFQSVVAQSLRLRGPGSSADAVQVDFSLGVDGLSLEDAYGRQALRAAPEELQANGLRKSMLRAARSRSASSATHFVYSKQRTPLSANHDLFSVRLSDGAEVQLTSDLSDTLDFADPAIVGDDCIFSKCAGVRKTLMSVPLAGGEVVRAFPIDHILINGDSFVGLGYQTALVSALPDRKIDTIAVGGTDLDQQAAALAANPRFLNSLIVIMEGGLGGGVENLTPQIEMFKPRFKRWCILEPSPQEMAAGTPGRINFDARVQGIRDAYPDNFIDCLAILQSFNDGSPEDLADVANNIVPRSLRVDTIHETAFAYGVRAELTRNFLESKGW